MLTLFNAPLKLVKKNSCETCEAPDRVDEKMKNNEKVVRDERTQSDHIAETESESLSYF